MVLDDWTLSASFLRETKSSWRDAGRYALYAIGCAGCGGKNDTISQAEKTENNRPSIAETKDIAEQGYIFGPPMAMNYAIITVRIALQNILGLQLLRDQFDYSIDYFLR
jgi:hypothetical protein